MLRTLAVGNYDNALTGTLAAAIVGRRRCGTHDRAVCLGAVARSAHQAAVSHCMDRQRRRAHRRGIPGADKRWLSLAGGCRRAVPLRRRPLRAHRQRRRAALALEQHRDVVCSAQRRPVGRLPLRRCELHQGRQDHELSRARGVADLQRHAFRAGCCGSRVGDHFRRTETLRWFAVGGCARSAQPPLGVRQIAAVRRARRLVVGRQRSCRDGPATARVRLRCDEYPDERRRS